MCVKKDLTKTMVVIIMIFFSHTGVSYGQNDVEENISFGIERVGKTMAPLETMAENATDIEEMSLLDLINMGGVVGYLIILLSIVSLGLMIDYSTDIRRSKIAPEKDVSTLRELIKNHNLNEIDPFDKRKSSFLAKMVVAGIKESPMGYGSMIKAMEDTGEALTSAIARKIEHLNVIGNISPMLGLLGTVIGMLRCLMKFHIWPVPLNRNSWQGVSLRRS